MMDASFFCALDCIVKIDSRHFFKTLRRLNENPSAFQSKHRGVSFNQ